MQETVQARVIDVARLGLGMFPGPMAGIWALKNTTSALLERL
jgi:hypothetical protein